MSKFAVRGTVLFFALCALFLNNKPAQAQQQTDQGVVEQFVQYMEEAERDQQVKLDAPQLCRTECSLMFLRRLPGNRSMSYVSFMDRPENVTVHFAGQVFWFHRRADATWVHFQQGDDNEVVMPVSDQVLQKLRAKIGELATRLNGERSHGQEQAAL